MRRKNIILEKNLYIELYLIGYKNIGESIVFLIYCDSRVVYSGVIDSYEQEMNKAVEILERNNVNSLDFICWTHPDEDHSIGIDTLIEKYASENTTIYIPECINGSEYSYNERVKSTFDIIDNTLASRKKNCFKVKSASDYKVLEMFCFAEGHWEKRNLK
jgi:beta-lactamase superfamily II metal-dependent hydrolase